MKTVGHIIAMVVFLFVLLWAVNYITANNIQLPSTIGSMITN